MPDRDLRPGPQGIQDPEALGIRDVFQVDPAEAGLDQHDRLDDLVRVLGVEHDRPGVDAAQVLVEQRLALHHRQPGLGPDVAQAEDARAVRDHGDGVPLVGVLVDQVHVLGDRPARGGDARRVPDGEVIEIADGALERDLDLAAVERMQHHRIRGGLLGLGQERLNVYRRNRFRHRVAPWPTAEPSADVRRDPLPASTTEGTSRYR